MLRNLFKIPDSSAALKNLRVLQKFNEETIREDEKRLLDWLTLVDHDLIINSEAIRREEMSGIKAGAATIERRQKLMASAADIRQNGQLTGVVEAQTKLGTTLYQDYTAEQLAGATKGLRLSPLMDKLVNNSAKEPVLYHGSAFLADELKPGFQHTKKSVVWDKYESNHYLYATSDKRNAELLGLSSAWEKLYALTSTHFDQATSTFNLVFDKGQAPDVALLKEVMVYVYTVPYNPSVWQKNNNPNNNIEDEYRTKETITTILDREILDVRALLSKWTINITEK